MLFQQMLILNVFVTYLLWFLMQLHLCPFTSHILYRFYSNFLLVTHVPNLILPWMSHLHTSTVSSPLHLFSCWNLTALRCSRTTPKAHGWWLFARVSWVWCAFCNHILCLEMFHFIHLAWILRVTSQLISPSICLIDLGYLKYMTCGIAWSSISQFTSKT